MDLQRFTGLLGVATMIGLAYVFSTDRKAIRLKTVLWGLSLQIIFAFLVLKFEYGRQFFQVAGEGVKWLISFSYIGAEFVFGNLGSPKTGFYFAFQISATIIFIASFFAILYHIGVMQIIIRQLAVVMTRLMGASGAESLNVAASIFMGQTEAPLTIRPFLEKLTRSELMVVMTSGMAHVSGGIMGAYILFGIEAKHLLTAVIMTAPGTLLIAKMLVPETEQPLTAGRVEMADLERDANILGAIARGTGDGLKLAINVMAMLIAFIALIALTNGIMGGIHDGLAFYGVSWFPQTIEQVLGWLFQPVAFVIGVPWTDTSAIGTLLGKRMVLNEFLAFADLGKMKDVLDPRSFTIATFALCGFANFSSIGIQIGGISALAPGQRDQLAKLGLRAMLAGTMANLVSASIAGILL